MKTGVLFLLLCFGLLVGMDLENGFSRKVGQLLIYPDLMHKKDFIFRNGNYEVANNEIIAVQRGKEWFYALIVIKPTAKSSYFSLVSFANDPIKEFYKNFVIDFTSRKVKRLAQING